MAFQELATFDYAVWFEQAKILRDQPSSQVIDDAINSR
jgi:hypothetical protein